VQRIKDGFDWTVFFKDPSSRRNMIPNQTFDGPVDWRTRIDKMEQEVNQIVQLVQDKKKAFKLARKSPLRKIKRRNEGSISLSRNQQPGQN
jgi:hypothetical protein